MVAKKSKKEEHSQFEVRMLTWVTRSISSPIGKGIFINKNI